MDYCKLLGRKEVDFDLSGLDEFLKGKSVLVTGANGSIGSELCQSLVRYPIAKLVQLFRSERGLVGPSSIREGSHGQIKIEHYIGDITDAARMDFIFRETKPNLVFHAAAHKHVPLMERYPGEALKNNVFGTQVLTAACTRYGSQLVFVSTDKAMNPTSVMGATKRLGEVCVQQASSGHDGFCMARLINVIGSSGSVLEIWKRQLDAGEPLTITHPEMTRYFMTCREAALLLLKAASIAKGNERFVFDMNQSTKILELAHRFAETAKARAARVSCIGIRPGEKIHEESPCDENATPVSPGIRAIYLSEEEDMWSRLNRAVNAAPEAARTALKDCLPEYQPASGEAKQHAQLVS